jgi:acyl carrier protein
MSTMYESIVDLMVNRFEVDPGDISPDVTFEDLGVDSLFLVELLLEVQSTLGVPIPEDVATPRDSISRAAELIEAQVSTAGAVE